MKCHAALLVFAVAALSFSCQRKDESAADSSTATTEQSADASADAKSAATGAPATGDENATPAKVDLHPRVKLVTTKGDIVIELDREKAPGTVENFLGYVKRKHYDGTVFHRIIDGFMIQGGGFALQNGKAVEKPTGPGIKNEGGNGLQNNRGTIAMARTGKPDSATAQFFINVKDNAGLNRPNPDGFGYAVFGKVVEGMDVVDTIKSVPTGQATLYSLHPVSGELMPRASPNVPTEPVVITAAILLDSAEK
jgi:peptidyl-prolyl cis-trans isomerase A (cyclophilin A)